LLPVRIDEGLAGKLAANAARIDGYSIMIDLEGQTVSDADGRLTGFEIDSFRRHCLLNGLDDIGLTLQHEAKIAEYERARA